VVWIANLVALIREEFKLIVNLQGLDVGIDRDCDKY
jgi:hypothetical protein